MLTIFRKQQKTIFLVVTAVIIVTFVFNLPTSGPDLTNEKGGKQRDVENFLQEGDTPFFQALGSINGHFISENILQTGIAGEIYSAFEEDLKGDLEAVILKMNSFDPYVHPAAPFLSVVRLQQSGEALMQDKERLKTMPVSREAFDLLVSIYLRTQKGIGLEQMRSTIANVEQKMAQFIPKDPQLRRADLSLFGLHSLEEWFGSKMVKIMALFCTEGAKKAESAGYKVQPFEVKEALLVSVRKEMESTFLKEKFSDKQVAEELLRILSALRIEEKTVIDLSGQMLSFKKFLDEKALGATLFDPLVLADYKAYAGAFKKEKKVQLPPEFTVRNLEDLMRIETYFDLACEKRSQVLALPEKILPVHAIKAPELLKRKVVMTKSLLHLNELRERIPLKESWAWEEKEENWVRLCEHFPQLIEAKGKSTEEKMELLENLDTKTRFAIDRMAEKYLIEEKPGLIASALASTPLERVELSLYQKGGISPLPGFKDGQELLAFIDNKKFITGESPDGGEHIYRMVVEEEKTEPSLISLKEALSSGVLSRLVDEKLEARYRELVSKNAAVVKKEGNLLPFKEVRSEVGALVFRKVLDSLKKAIGRDLPVDSLATKRFDFVKPSKTAWQFEEKEEKIFRADLDTQEQQRLFGSGSFESEPVHFSAEALTNEAKRNLVKPLLTEVKLLVKEGQ